MSQTTITAPCELEVCPWCKKKPNLIKREMWAPGGHGYYGCYAYFVECANTKCKIRPATKHYNDIYDRDTTAIKDACEDWNTREGETNEKK